MGTQIIGESINVEYSTPLEIVNPLIEEFSLTIDVCASSENNKLPTYWTKEEDALSKEWIGNCWMNPPFSRNLGKWVKKAHNESKINGGTKVCLIPVRSNTKWWADICMDAEIRFINGEVKFNNEQRGLWLPMCILIFGEKAKIGNFSIINYRL
jgi:phage N-6-adenine-methyltransferase